MKLESHNCNSSSVTEPVEDPPKKGNLLKVGGGNLDSPSKEIDDDPGNVKSVEDPSKKSQKGYLFNINSRNDGGFWPVEEFDDFESAQVKMVEEKREDLAYKNVPELEVPEIVVCYKENHDLSVNVKDISVDENMPSCERILFETNTDKEDLRTFLLAEKTARTEFKEESDVSTHDNDSIMETDVDADEGKPVKTLATVQEAEAEALEEFSDDTCDENIQVTAREPSEEPGDDKELNPVNPSIKESDNPNPVDKLPTIGEDGSEKSGNRESDNFQSKNMSKVSDSFREQHRHGESSFSMAGPMSGLITYSGPITHSGSVSLRSDASSTSTRSFAFPVLHPEWQSSPVRMAKADRRHLRKHKWCGLLCCRF